MLTPGEIASRRFTVALRGYERDEVESFLRTVADDVETLRERIRRLESHLEERPPPMVPEAPGASPSGHDPGAGSAAAVDPAAGADRPSMLRSLGEEAARLLVTAEESADEIRRRAETDAERTRLAAEQESDTLLAAARAERDQTLEDAREEAARLRSEAADLIADAEADRRTVLDARDRLVERLEDAMQQVAETVKGVTDPDRGPSSDTEARGPSAHAGPREPAPMEGSAPADTAGAEDVPDDTGDPDEPQALTLRRRTLDAVRPAMLRHARRALQDGQNAVLSRLAPRDHDADGTAGPPPTTDLGDRDFRSFDSTVATYVVGAMRGGAGDTAFLLRAAAPDDVVDPSLVAELRTGLRTIVRTRLAERLDAAGASPADRRPSLVDAAFDEARETLGPLVDDLLVSAYAAGQVAAADRLGAAGLRWLSVPEPECPDDMCAVNADAGTVPAGGSFPHGGDAPPAHLGCACGLTPVVGEPDAPSP